MAFTNPAKRQGQQVDYGLSGPRAAFLASMLALAAVWAFAIRALPHDAVMPAITTGMFGLAAAFALIAWRRRYANDGDVTYGDVAGAITLIGVCTAALIEPDQLVGLVAERDNNR